MTTTIRTSTQAAVISALGGPEELHVADIPVSTPGGEQVQIEVAAAAVNPVDLSTRAGRNIPVADAHFPMVLGWDLAGTVTVVGDGVTALRPGDRVAATVFQPVDQRGTYAGHVTIDTRSVARVPAGLELPHADTVPLTALTAASLLDAVTAGDTSTLLVTGALGAVGRHVVVLAVRAGLDVLAAVSPERSAELSVLGAATAVGRGDFTRTVLAAHPSGVDAAIDLVGASVAHAAFDAVRDGGRYATSVPPYIDPTGRFDDARGIQVHTHVVAPDTPRLTELLELAADGVLGTRVQATYALATPPRPTDARPLAA